MSIASYLNVGFEFALLQGTRDASAASGDQSLTGAGFSPTGAVIIAGISSNAATSIGFDDGTLRQAIWNAHNSTPNTWGADTNYSIYITTAAGAAYSGVLTMNPDGVTITWTKTGLPTGTITFTVLAFR